MGKKETLCCLGALSGEVDIMMVGSFWRCPGIDGDAVDAGRIEKIVLDVGSGLAVAEICLIKTGVIETIIDGEVFRHYTVRHTMPPPSGSGCHCSQGNT